MMANERPSQFYYLEIWIFKFHLVSWDILLQCNLNEYHLLRRQLSYYCDTNCQANKKMSDPSNQIKF